MRDDGSKLRSLIKEKGYDFASLAKVLKISTVAINNDLKSKTISRRSLVKYVPLVVDTLDGFYESESKAERKSDVTGTVSIELFSELQNRYIDLQSRFIELQAKHLALTERFFPSAVQRPSISA